MRTEFDVHEEQLIYKVELECPKIAEMVRDSVKNDVGHILFHQDAFAADYQAHEYLLLGMVIKYIGLVAPGKEIVIVGENRETLK